MKSTISLDLHESVAATRLDQFASAVSLVCAPPLLSLSLIWLVAERASRSPYHMEGVVTLVILLGGLPALFILVGHWLGYIRDLELSRQSDRMAPALFATACAIVAQPVLAAMGSAALMTSLATLMAVQLATLAFITNWWRISYHAATIFTLGFASFHLHGPAVALPLLLLAGIVGWSRVRLGRHTPAQVVAGALTAAPALWWIWPSP